MKIRFGKKYKVLSFTVLIALISFSACKDKKNVLTVDKDYIGKDKLTVHTDIMEYIDDNEGGIHYMTKEELEAMRVKGERENYIYNTLKDGSLIDKYTEKR